MCLIDGCVNQKIFAKGLCSKHYKKLRRNTIKDEIIDKSCWSIENIAWVAGLIEGEGNFNLRESKLSMRIRVRMTDLDVLQKAYNLFKIGKIYGPYYRKNPKHKTAWEWSINRHNQVVELCRVIAPYLLSRRLQQMNNMLKGYHSYASTKMFV